MNHRILVVYDLDGTLIDMKPIKEQIEDFARTYKYVPKGKRWLDTEESLRNVALNYKLLDVIQYTNDNRSEDYKVALISNRKTILNETIKRLLARLGVDVDYILLQKDKESKFERLKTLLDGQSFNKLFIYEDDIKQIKEYEQRRPYIQSLNIEYNIYNVNDYQYI